MVDLLFVRIRFGIALADTFGDHAGIALGVAEVFAILALHARRILKELSAKSASHDVVELVLNKLVPVHLVDFLLALSDGTFTPKTEINLTSVVVLFVEADFKLYLTRRLEVEPTADRPGVHLRLRSRCSKRAFWAHAARRSRRVELALGRAHRELRWRLLLVTHPIRRHPAGAVHLSLDPLSACLLYDV